jgi:hypothetical protein
MQISATAAQSAYYLNMRQSSNVQPQPETTTTQTSRARDTVEISSEGKAKLSELSLTPDVSSGCIQDQMDYDRKWIENYLEKKIGIKDGENYSFKIGTDGHVNVSGGEKADEIEKAFEEDFELHNRLMRFSSHSSMVRAIREHMEFVAAYEQDPEQAVAMYSHLFDNDNKPVSTFEYSSSGGLNVYFEGMYISGKEYLDY